MVVNLDSCFNNGDPITSVSTMNEAMISKRSIERQSPRMAPDVPAHFRVMIH
jgi:hypothetical protein